MVTLGDCTHFKCESCGKIKPAEEARIVYCAFTISEKNSTQCSYFKQKILVCKKCNGDKEKENDSKNNRRSKKKNIHTAT